MTKDTEQPWWQHPSYTVTADSIELDGHSLETLAQTHGTPLYVFSKATIQRQLRRMQQALQEAVREHTIYYAMKSNRNPGVLAAIRELGNVGLDTCSPREVQLALQSGFLASEISFNAGMLSMRDMKILAESEVHCTLDTFSALRRYATLVPQGTHIGLRFNPGTSASYGNNPRLSYGQAKFGFEPNDASLAIEAATRAGLVVDSIHMHLGWGLPQKDQAQIQDAFDRLAHIATLIPTLQSINVGGGLGGRYVLKDEPLLLESWAESIHRCFAPLDIRVICEPGTFVSAPSGALLVEVNTIEERRGTCWVGIDAGFAVNLNPAHYGIHLTPVPVRNPLGKGSNRYTIAGNINEAGDLWGTYEEMPELKEGDLLALLPAGAYSASMSSDHCLRGQAKEIAL